MSKKSRRRNKKILAALAAGLGAAALAKGKKVAVTGVVNPNAPKSNWISKKEDVVESAPIIEGGTGGGVVHQGKPPKINPWRGVAPAPPGILNPYKAYRPNRFNRLKGGGIAKRGTGAAYKSGGRVKSMGIAKRGGGVAKR